MADLNGSGRWSEAIEGRHPVQAPPRGPVRIGVLPGEGVGPEVLEAALHVLSACGLKVALRKAQRAPEGGAGPRALTENDVRFCRDTFAAGGAVLAGPHGGRWVYEVRRRLDLFCKLSPIRPPAELHAIDAPISPGRLSDVDVLVVREQSAGVYQGRWGESATHEGRMAEHSFSYSEREVRRIIAVAVSLAEQRRGGLTLVAKDGGLPSISAVWRDCAIELVRDRVDLEVLDVDYAVYRLLREPRRLDVLVAPNLFGDVLSDAGGALLGSRGNTYGGNFDSARAAVYQTNHGAAHDLAGRDRANPAGQILALAMLLRESFGLETEGALIERALASAWREGWRTEDVAEPGSRVIGTREMGERVAERVAARPAAARLQ